jgi:hypothetical protein
MDVFHPMPNALLCRSRRGHHVLRNPAPLLARAGDARAVQVEAFIIRRAAGRTCESSTAIATRAIFLPVEWNKTSGW